MYYCKACNKHQQLRYERKPLSDYDHQLLIKLNNEGLGIRGIGRVLNIPRSTVSKLLIETANTIKAPRWKEKGEEYEIDELRVKLAGGGQETWLCYAINRRSKEVISYVVARKTKENIAKVVEAVLQLEPKKVFTDKLRLYKSLIPEEIHSVQYRGTNYIERKNLTLRTHLRRLNRKTLCCTRKVEALDASLRIYFGGGDKDFSIRILSDYKSERALFFFDLLENTASSDLQSEAIKRNVLEKEA